MAPERATVWRRARPPRAAEAISRRDPGNDAEIATYQSLDNIVDRFLGFTRVRQQVPGDANHRRCTT
jgi:hypothetical protein